MRNNKNEECIVLFRFYDHDLAINHRLFVCSLTSKPLKPDLVKVSQIPVKPYVLQLFP